MGCRLQHRFLITALPLVSKDKVKYTNNQFMACYANSFIFDQGCSYLAKLLLMVCKLLSTLHITVMALKSKVNENLSYSGMFLTEVLHICRVIANMTFEP